MYSNTPSESDAAEKIGEMKICINIKKSHQMRKKKLFMLALFAVHIQNKFLCLGCEKINCRNKYEPSHPKLSQWLEIEFRKKISGTKKNKIFK
jgi:hypothetical protein